MSPNRLAVVPAGNRLDVVSVNSVAGSRPSVSRCESYPIQGDLTQTLQRLQKANKLAGACTTVLGAGDYQFLNIEAPALPADVPQSEVREAVRWKVKDLVDFPVTAAGIDVVPIPVTTGRPQSLFAAVASHAVLTPQIRAFQHAKVALDTIDIRELAQRNFAHLFEQPQRALALLVFDANGGLLTFTFQGDLYAFRRIDITAEELSSDTDSTVFDRVVLDVQRSLDNFERNFSRLTLGQLLVLPVAGADRLVPHLKDNLYQPIDALDVHAGLDIDAAPTLANPALLANYLPAIGAALREGA